MDAPVVLTVADSGAVSWQSGALSDDNYVRDPVSGFRVAVSRLLDSGEMSDFAIKTKTKTIKVHKFIIRQSSFFSAACDGSFKEALEGVIDLSAEDERLLDLVIRWLYGPYSESWSKLELTKTLTMLDIIHLSETAARLGVCSLAHALIQEFHLHLQESWNTVVSPAVSPEALDDLVNAVYDDGTAGSKEMRAPLASHVAERVCRCEEDEYLAIQNVIKHHDSAFAVDVAVCLANSRRVVHGLGRGDGQPWDLSW